MESFINKDGSIFSQCLWVNFSEHARQEHFYTQFYSLSVHLWEGFWTEPEETDFTQVSNIWNNNKKMARAKIY